MNIKDIYEKGNYTFLELEDYLNDNTLDQISFEEVIQNFNISDIIYLVDAYKMPLDEMTEYIKEYDNSRHYADELRFVRDLALKYGTQSNDVIRRIQEVRIVNKAKKILIRDKKSEK